MQQILGNILEHYEFTEAEPWPYVHAPSPEISLTTEGKQGQNPAFTYNVPQDSLAITHVSIVPVVLDLTRYQNTSQKVNELSLNTPSGLASPY